jgi:hypothetical protein
MKTPVFKILTTATLVAVVFIFYLFNPESYSFFPKCTFYRITGWQCPGCGTQRAFYHLLHLDLKKAVSYNPFFIIGLPVLALALALELFDLQELRKRIFTRKLVITGSIIVILFGIMRNIYPVFSQTSITPKEIRKNFRPHL